MAKVSPDLTQRIMQFSEYRCIDQDKSFWTLKF